LTDALRRLGRNGLVQREVTTTSPIAVEYSITPLGRTLQDPLLALYDWAVEYQDDLAAAQQRFDIKG
jgi:DNA-binding HxlR family transcriptional regulator